MRRLAVASALMLITLVGCSNGPTVAAPTATTTTPTVVRSSPQTQPAPVTTTAPAPTPPQTYSGKGSDVIDLTTPVDFGIINFACPKCSGNTMLKSDAEIDNLLVNEIGSYSGQRWIGMRGDKTSRLQITAKGDWTVTVGGLDLAARHDGRSPVAGRGDQVLLLLTGPDTVTLSHDGKSNFVVQVMTDSMSSPDLAVNEIGTYDGTVLFLVDGTEAALVQITADGDWSLTPKV